jgi:flagellar protein FliJ
MLPDAQENHHPMKRFRFPLKPVKVLRSHEELRAREVFATAVHAYVQTEAALAEERRRVAEFEARLREVRQERYQAGDAASLFQSYRAECAEEMAAERAVIEAKAKMQQRRNEYIEANRRLKVICQLEDKALAGYRTETLRAEQLELDDLAGLRSRRRSVLS